MANELEVRRGTMEALESYRQSFGAAGVGQAWEEFRGRIGELVATTPAFAGADTASKLLICRRIAATNLWPGLGSDGEAYVVKYGAGANYTVGPRGWISLLYRAGAKRVTAACVHLNDTFDPGSIIPPKPPTLVPSNDANRSALPFTHAIAFVEWHDGTTDWAVADTAYLERVKKASPAGDKGPWGKWPEQMAKAKALRLLAREVSRRVEIPDAMRVALSHAIEADKDGLPEDEASAAAPEKPTEPPPVTTKARGSRAKKTEASPAGEAPPTSPAAPSGPSTDAASASAGPAGDPAPETLESLVDRALKARPTERDARAEFETTYEGVSLHAVSIRRAIGGPFADEAEAVAVLRKFIG